MEVRIETPRLILRPWAESDADALYRHATDPEVGTPAGWPAHESVEMSREVIRTVFSVPDTYAIVLRDTGEPVGCVGVVPPSMRHVEGMAEGDMEIGYWLGRTLWGRGLVPEAIGALIEYLSHKYAPSGVWIGFYDGNNRSRRVAEKCGFTYHHTQCTDGQTEHFYRRKGLSSLR